jgi:hypothetical protein
MYHSSTTYLHKLVVKVLSQVVNTSSAKRCWSTCSFIHSVKKNNLNDDQAESLVYVHYNLRLLSHYCDATGNDYSKRSATWDNNPEETNLEAELLGDHDGDYILGVDMPPPSTSSIPDASIFPLSSQCPLSHGGHSATNRVPRTLPPTPTPLLQRSREKKIRSFLWQEENLEHSA